MIKGKPGEASLGSFGTNNSLINRLLEKKTEKLTFLNWFDSLPGERRAYMVSANNPVLILTKDKTHMMAVPIANCAVKLAYFIEPSGEYVCRELAFLVHDSRDTEFRENISEVVPLEASEFLKLLASGQDSYQKALVDRSDIEKVLGLRNKFYSDELLRALKGIYAHDISEKLSEVEKSLNNPRTRHFILKNVNYMPFAAQNNFADGKINHSLAGLICNKAINVNHVGALISDINNRPDAIFKDLMLEGNNSKVYPVPAAATEATKALEVCCATISYKSRISQHRLNCEVSKVRLTK